MKTKTSRNTKADKLKAAGLALLDQALRHAGGCLLAADQACRLLGTCWTTHKAIAEGVAALEHELEEARDLANVPDRD
jgi:hypothetical protein